MVNIEYTGVNGKTTRFGSRSANDAMNRLSGISGYRGNVMDSAAACLAGAFAARHKNATRVAELASSAKTDLNGAYGVFAGASGRVTRTPRVTGISLENGRIVVSRQDSYVGDDGRTVKVGNVKHDTIQL